MKPSLVDVPVALIFFARPDVLNFTFEAIRTARPNKLFLIQDGSRENREDDIRNIEICQKIVSNIDWECAVYKNYSDVNLSCDHRVFTGISWAFEFVDKLVILEDDCVPSLSFLPFCAEILEKYKDDLRIHMICGMNYLDKFNGTDDSYFFSNVAAGWGWATWKRTWDLVIEQRNFDFLDNKWTSKLVADYIKGMGIKVNDIDKFIKKVKKIRANNIVTSKVNSWEYAVGAAMYLSSSMVITPRANLVSNIGLTNESTHAVNSIAKLSKATQKLFFKPTFKLDFPLKHPEYVIRNIQYEREHKKLIGENKFVLLFRKMEGIARRFYYSNNSERKNLILKAFQRIFPNDKR